MVCPPILVGHWAHEVARFVGASLRALACEGPPAARAALQRTLDEDLGGPEERGGGAGGRPVDLVVMSYEVRMCRACRTPIRDPCIPLVVPVARRLRCAQIA